MIKLTDMNTIFIVRYDWAFNGGSATDILGCYENLQDAMDCMSQYWEDERRMDYFERFNKRGFGNRMMEAWTDGYYYESHSKVEVLELYLYSHEDAIAGRC